MDDDRLLDDIGGLLRRVDPVPAEVTLAARSALAWRRLDAELAELLSDSATEAEHLAGVRGSAGGWRALMFEAPDGTTIEVEVAVERTTRTITGQIVPPGPATIILRSPDSELPVSADDLGRFRAEHLEPGPFSLRCEMDGQAIETGWVTI